VQVELTPEEAKLIIDLLESVPVQGKVKRAEVSALEAKLLPHMPPPPPPPTES
jgi:hypothetical protein